MKSILTVIKKLRRLNHINRCSLFPVLKPTSVAEHSWHVSIMVTCVAYEKHSEGWDIDINRLLSAALYHDSEESFITDVPFPIKNRIKLALKDVLNELIQQEIPNSPKWLFDLICNNNNLTTIEKYILKACDMAELVIYARDEYQMGNKKILPLLDRGLGELSDINSNLGSKLIQLILDDKLEYEYEGDTL